MNRPNIQQGAKLPQEGDSLREPFGSAWAAGHIKSFKLKQEKQGKRAKIFFEKGLFRAQNRATKPDGSFHKKQANFPSFQNTGEN